MNIAKAAAIAASAINVCGPRTGVGATPATIGKFGKDAVLQFMATYADIHDGELFTRAEIMEARQLLAA